MVTRPKAFGLGLLCALALVSPGLPAKDGTKYLENADRYLNEAPLIPQKPKPSPTPLPSPSPVDEKLAEPEEKSAPVSPRKNWPAPPAVIHSSRIFVGQEIPVPTGYSPARVQVGAGGYPVVTPSQPSSFETRRTGVLMESNGTARFEVTEFEGFINYGSPIRTAIPVYDEKGNPVGIQVLTTPNPILQPVFKTFRREER